MSVSACILSISGPVLRPEERVFLREAQPWGVILMGRSCIDPAQVHGLVNAIHDALGRKALIFIDQEGGRVARLKPPAWPKFPAAGVYGELYELNKDVALEACYLGHRLMGAELHKIGIQADCAPVGDLRQSDTHDAIGDRAFGYSVEAVTELANEALTGLKDAGVAGCIKHMPGQGRATVDSHYELPRVRAPETDLQQDLGIFKALGAFSTMGMTCHVIFETFDLEHPTTISSTVISEVIRGRIGFDGLLMTDDLGMEALGGRLCDRGERALAAGCDVLLHCSGFLKEPDIILSEMQEVAEAAGALDGRAKVRADAVAQSLIDPDPSFDVEAGWARFNHLLSNLEARV